MQFGKRMGSFLKQKTQDVVRLDKESYRRKQRAEILLFLNKIDVLFMRTCMQGITVHTCAAIDCCSNEPNY